MNNKINMLKKAQGICEIETMDIIDVDTELAALYLSENIKNRHISSPKVDLYAAEMERGDWRLNGEPIIISNNGKLLDGQHRLQAVIKSGATIKFLFIFGINENVFDTIDTGKSRSASDVLTIAGLNKMTADAVSIAIKSDIAVSITGRLGNDTKISRYTTNKNIREICERDSGFVDAAIFVQDNWTNSSPLSRGNLTFLLYRFRKLDGKDGFTDEWIRGLMSGENLDSNDKRLWIRNKIVREFSKLITTPIRYKILWVIRAWNLVRINKDIKNQSNFFRVETGMMKYISLETDSLGENNEK